MGKKDISTKNLEAYDDVFADIFNVLVFGDNYVKDSGLRDAGTEQVHGDFSGTLHSRYRDCMKQYQDTTMACVSLEIENQTDIDKTMPVRVMGYEEMETEISDNVRRGEAISMCDFADRMERRGLEKGLKSLLRTLKTIFTEFEDIYQKVILNEDYKDRSREEIRMMLEEV